MKTISRRNFVTGCTAALGIAGYCSARMLKGLTLPLMTGSAEKPTHRNRIAVSTYSFWRFKEGLKLPIETCIDEAARMGFEGVDILHIQMEQESNDYLQGLKRRALINGIDLCCLSTHQDFVSPDKAERQKISTTQLSVSSLLTVSAYPLYDLTRDGGAQQRASMSLWPTAASNRRCRDTPMRMASSG
jgi:hypothetical protein